MARYTGPRCRLCRRAGMKLFLKGERCYTPKCAFEKRKYPPGQRPKRGIRISDYLIQLKEKQKLKRIYSLMEKQFRILYEKAENMKGDTGENLILLLERRLDNVVYKMCFASSRAQARQLVRHGHILVNGRKVDIPSYMVKAGDEISIKEKSRKMYPILKSLTRLETTPLPEWISVDPEKFTGKVLRLPEPKDIDLQINPQLIVEFYSKV